MPGKRITDLTALSGANSANNDDLVIFDATASETKRISRSQLAEGMQADVQVLSNKTLALGSNTVTGTTAQFNTALTDNNFATQAGAETLTNKTIALANNTVNYNQGGTGASTRTVQSRLQDYVSVKDFGAVGDNVVDDTAAIQAAADHCNITGQSLFVPAGEYKITSTITFTQVSVECEDASRTRFWGHGSFTAFKFIAARKTFRNFNLWFVPPVTSAAIGYQFGEGASQFARNVVDSMFVRFAYKGFFSSSDMWGNTFRQLNSDFSLNYGFDFTANPSGTTDTFINTYAVNANTTGSISSGSNSLTVADAQNLSVGLSLVILGAGATGPLISTITGVSGTTITLAGTATNTVSSTKILLNATAWRSVSFSDLHLLNAYFDAYPSNGNSLNGCVDFTDSYVWANNLRFESCAITANNTAFVNVRSNFSDIGTVSSFASLIDVGTGNYGFACRFGTGARTQHRLGDVLLQGFTHYSGGIKRARLASSDNLTITSALPSPTDCDDNGFQGHIFYGRQLSRSLTPETPATGDWDVGDWFSRRAPSVGGQLGGACLTSGSYGTLSALTADTTSGSNLIAISSAASLRRGQFVSIAGVTGVYKVMDIQSTTLLAVVVPAVASTVSGAAVTLAAPTFSTLGAPGESVAASAIAAVANAINTTGKYRGKQVYDTTNNRLMVASGSTAASAWFIADGSASVVPS